MCSLYRSETWNPELLQDRRLCTFCHGQSGTPASGRTVAFVSDLRGPLLGVVCEPYKRREVDGLIRQYGADAKLPDLA